MFIGWCSSLLISHFCRLYVFKLQKILSLFLPVMQHPKDTRCCIIDNICYDKSWQRLSLYYLKITSHHCEQYFLCFLGTPFGWMISVIFCFDYTHQVKDHLFILCLDLNILLGATIMLKILIIIIIMKILKRSFSYCGDSNNLVILTRKMAKQETFRHHIDLCVGHTVEGVALFSCQERTRLFHRNSLAAP